MQDIGCCHHVGNATIGVCLVQLHDARGHTSNFVMLTVHCLVVCAASIIMLWAVYACADAAMHIIMHCTEAVLILVK